MVKNTGTTLHLDAGRPVNAPEFVNVEEAPSDNLPLAVWAPRRQVVVNTGDSWRIDDEWWRSEPVSRFYCNVMLASGQRMVLYKDLVTGRWYKQDY
jgi:hypothetical protein